MSPWDRIQRLELDLVAARAVNDRLVTELAAASNNRTLDKLRVATHQLVELTESRDLARRVAMRLEEENHQLARDIDALMGALEDVSDASLAVTLSQLDIRTREAGHVEG